MEICIRYKSVEMLGRLTCDGELDLVGGQTLPCIDGGATLIEHHL